MLRRVMERKQESLVVLGFLLVLGLLSVHAYFFEGKRLSKLVAERAEEVRLLQESDIRITAEIGALRAEIESLKSDTEDTSLVARTMFGMVSSDEVIYQLNSAQYEE